MDIGRIIQLLRTADGISQTKLADELGISRAYLSQVENGHNDPGLQLLRKISSYFEIPLSLLVADEDEYYPEISKGLRDMLGDFLKFKLSVQNTSDSRMKKNKKPAKSR
ncbi:MAG TPA: helix-turn-helix transcriptional regulator [bacterium]|jgi:transcriptional regulator with XRE-family HTH domain